MYSLNLVEYYQRYLDLTVLPSLIHLIANSLFVLEQPQATAIAKRHVGIAENVLILHNAESSEVSPRV